MRCRFREGGGGGGGVVHGGHTVLHFSLIRYPDISQ